MQQFYKGNTLTFYYLELPHKLEMKNEQNRNIGYIIWWAGCAIDQTEQNKKHMYISKDDLY